MIYTCDCGVRNRVPDDAASAKCGTCKRVLFETILCLTCQTKNRIPTRATKAACGRCETLLQTSHDASWSPEFVEGMRDRLNQLLKKKE